MRPPYAAEMLEAKREGRPVNLFVYAGRNAWRFAEHRPKGARLVVRWSAPGQASQLASVARTMDARQAA